MPAALPLTPEELAQARTALIGGARVQLGGSRCYSSLQVDAQGWFWADFDEGQQTRRAASPADLDELAARDPAALYPILQAPHWQRFREQLALRQLRLAREHLQHWMRYGDRHGYGRILLAVLDWPESPPCNDVVALIRASIGDFTAYHLFMETAGWQQDAQTGTRGIAFLKQLQAMAGEDTPGAQAILDAFQALIDNDGPAR